jgi:hypothetical protein
MQQSTAFLDRTLSVRLLALPNSLSDVRIHIASLALSIYFEISSLAYTSGYRVKSIIGIEGPKIKVTISENINL